MIIIIIIIKKAVNKKFEYRAIFFYSQIFPRAMKLGKKKWQHAKEPE